MELLIAIVIFILLVIKAIKGWTIGETFIGLLSGIGFFMRLVMIFMIFTAFTYALSGFTGISKTHDTFEMSSMDSPTKLVLSILLGAIEAIVLFDVLWSFYSFLMVIPIGKPFFSPRLPFLVTVVIMFIQRSKIMKKNYCTVCNRNLDVGEQVLRCVYCDTLNPIKLMNLSGAIYYKCSNPECKETFVVSLHGNARTRFSRISPFGKSNSQKAFTCCKYCQNKLNSDFYVVNLSIYTNNLQLAKSYRETFFYNSFGAGKKNIDINLATNNNVNLALIDKYYKGLTSRTKGDNDIPTDMISIELRSAKYKLINYTIYQFRIAMSNDSFKLMSSEGIILLINGDASALEMETLVDKFLIDLSSINTQSKIWSNPVLIGISANGVSELRNKIKDGFSNTDDMNSFCEMFLSSKNADSIIPKIRSYIPNYRFFIYRTGNLRDKTESDIYNVVPPVQGLLYSAQGVMKKYWTKDSNGMNPFEHEKK